MLVQLPQPHQQTAEHESRWPDPIKQEGYYGIAGDFVRLIEPHSEADPAALLLQFLVAAGNVIGRGPYFVAESDRHYLNLFAVMVGATSKGRKGSSWSHVRRIWELADETWRVAHGLSSGEGLIWAVRDCIIERQPVKVKGRVVDYEDVVVDPGVDDKRLLIFEAEFAATLRVISRDNNTLSAVIRTAWDTGQLRILTKNSPVQATNAHISIIAHVTREEVLRYLDTTDAGNGFANRFLWVAVRRSKTLPDGGQVQEADMVRFARRLKQAVEFARSVGEMHRDDEARQVWYKIYPKLSEGKPGLFGAVIARAEAQVMRLACLYAVLDFSHIVRREHLEAALAVWDYCESSARWVFGDALGDPIADRILQSLRKAPRGLTRSGIQNLLGRNIPAARISVALDTLLAAGLVRREKHTSPGRPAEKWFAVFS